jgi:hypothetical protein
MERLNTLLQKESVNGNDQFDLQMQSVQQQKQNQQKYIIINL